MTAETRRLRILIVTRNLPPLVGGMERLNWHMAAELSKVAEVRVVGPEGSAALAPQGVVVREAPLRPLWKFLMRARTLARREAKAWQPQVVLAGSGLTAPLARTAARLCGAKTAVYVHGLDIAVRSVVYRALWLPAIRGMDRIIANSHATADLCRGIGVDPTRIGIVHPGVDLPRMDEHPVRNEGARAAGAILPPLQGEGRGGDGVSGLDTAKRPTPSSSIPLPSEGGGTRPSERGDHTTSEPAASAFRQRHNLGNRPLLLSVGRLSARKGLREFVTQSLPRIVVAQPDAMLLIVGDAPNQALHAEAQTPESIQAAADAAGAGNHIRFLGTITDYAELGTVYRAADVHVFPVRAIAGDPEGFGMVAVESAAHGLPTVAFATGGVVDAIAEETSGYLVESGDYTAFSAAVLRALAAREELRLGCIAFARGFAWPAFGKQIAAQLPGFPHSGLHVQGAPT